MEYIKVRKPPKHVWGRVCKLAKLRATTPSKLLPDLIGYGVRTMEREQIESFGRLVDGVRARHVASS